MAHRVPITVRLDSFEGPLDLLLYLIQSHELNISKIAISKITDQYLAYVRLMQELNFDTASEFLLMAATLVLWKSKSLLPSDQELNPNAVSSDDDAFSPEDLLRQLLDHQRFLNAGKILAQLPRKDEDVFTRPNLRPPVEKIWKDMEITALAVGYQDLVTRARKRTQVLRKETVSISEKISHFSERLQMGIPTAFSKLLSLSPDRPEVVVTFLASLELSRLKRLRLHQEKTFDEIYIELIDSLKGFDLSLATGFDLESGDKNGLIHSIESDLQTLHEQSLQPQPVILNGAF